MLLHNIYYLRLQGASNREFVLFKARLLFLSAQLDPEWKPFVLSPNQPLAPCMSSQTPSQSKGIQVIMINSPLLGT